MENLVNQTILNQFTNKKIVITGHTGFKGAWLAQLLLNVTQNIKGIALKPNTSPNLFDSLNLEKKLDSVFADINDFENLEKQILSFEPDYIFHLAAQPLVRYSYVHTLETYKTNVIGTANILESCKKLTNPCVVVCITTDKVYHNKEEHYAYSEGDHLGGHDPYSSSKAAAELIIDSYRKSFFSEGHIQVASARAGNVIGGGDWSDDRLVPDIVKSIQKNSKIILRNPSSVRPWQHVLDPLFGYLILAAKMNLNPHQFTEAWNFGPNNGEEKTVSEVVNIFYDTYGLEPEVNVQNLNEPHEANLLMLNINKAKSILGWQPTWNTTRAIKETAFWYKSLNLNNAEFLVNKQIKTFLSNEL